MRNRLKWKLDGFIVALIAMIILAYIYPDLVEIGNGRFISVLSSVGIALVFFFYGLKLSFSEIKAGMKNWKLHISVQLFTFILFPVLVLLFRPFVQTETQEQFWLSFYFLAALPSTVTSSVVMVAIAKGNIPAAIFNASISGLIGVLMTPLLMHFFLEVTEVNMFAELYLGLLLEVILPVILGLFLQKYWGNWAHKYGKSLTKFDKAVVLLIVYNSFSESFISDVFHAIGTSYLLSLFAGVILLFFISYGLIFLILKFVLKFNREDRITGLFCGSKKSLTHGSVFAKFIFANNPKLGLYFLPLMVYHAFQIFVVSIIAQRLGKQHEEKGY
ncbi:MULTISPECIES: bile acid:sodium symporter family protein [Sphingobacterium]|uniref:Bile acid:sodium symporter family protein n=1 Tax=Sphingobacterium tenebrionis TaxID=3111775 RepID=A0ABU8I5V2_9SPHI|nr:bile acid:sodium symporter family protein [Sphingobacterium sp. CZ-2]QBR11423.1 bile acid:sodium symporter [Sphingobacterium sp. CZ-2]